MNIQCTVSETNFVYGCSLLRTWSIWSIQSHSLDSKWPHWSLNSKGITFLTKKLAWNATFWVLKLQTYFLYKLLLIGCDIFSHIIVFCLSWYLHLKHVSSLDFNNNLSKMGLTILVALPVSISKGSTILVAQPVSIS